MSQRPPRRPFLRAVAAAAAAAAVSACEYAPMPAPVATPPPAEPTPFATLAAAQPPAAPGGGPVARRPLGDTGVSLSVVGFGGIVVMNETDEAAAGLVAEAIARGINYFDVAPSYGDAELRLGPALAPYRDSVFLACKTEQRTKEAAASALRRSLERLRTGHFDLYQLHAVKTLAEVDRITAEDGALAAFVEARDQGLIGRIGFSAHSEEAALALLDRFPFDTILYPVNWACWHQGGFGPAVVARAEERGVAVLALKSLAKRDWRPGETRTWPKCWYAPAETAEEAALALRFTLSRPVVSAVSPSHAELLWWACDAARDPAPLSPDEEQQLAELSRDLDPVFPLA